MLRKIAEKSIEREREKEREVDRKEVAKKYKDWQANCLGELCVELS